MHRYMLEGIATPEVFASLIASPADRGANAKGLIEKAGGVLVDYYVGIHNYKGYVIVDLPDENALSELQMVLYASGAIADSTATKIVTTAELKTVVERAGKLAGAYKIPE